MCVISSITSVPPGFFFINLKAGSGRPSSISTALLASSLTSYTNLKQVLVLAVMDLQVSLFDHFLHCFKDRSVVCNVASSLVRGREKTTQVRQDLKGLLEASRKLRDH